jgi:deoxycytidine triphosphate deaminase
MPLGLDILLKLVREDKLIVDLGERDLTNPEGAGFDLRVGEVYGLKGPGLLGIDTRSSSPTELVASRDRDHTFVVPAGSYYLVRTIESVNMPLYLAASISPRTTLFRCGLSLDTAKVDPGYKGQLTFGLNNTGPFEFQLELGARIAHIMFDEVIGTSNPYRGQWQGGRVSTTGVEKQT